MNKFVNVIKMRVDVTSHNKVLLNVLELVDNVNSAYVCVSNVHMCMESFDDDKYRSIINNADIVVPDGLPLVWALKLLGELSAKQVRGQDLVLGLCEKSSEQKIDVGFLGSSEDVLFKLKTELAKFFPEINIVYTCSPPFRPLSRREKLEVIEQINKANPKILFVGLGCPKQEQWMFENRELLSCVMLGVGAAFDFIAGKKRSAPRWIQKVGLEWFFRLLSDPRRLWKRYLKHNPRFIYYFILQLLGKSYIK